MNAINLKPTSENSMEVVEDFVLNETQITRKVFRAIIVKNKKDATKPVREWIIHQRKRKNEEWEDLNPINLASLKAVEGIKLELKYEVVHKLLETFQTCEAIANEGIYKEPKELIVCEPGALLQIDGKRKHFIKKLIDQDYGNEVWEQLIESNPDLVSKLSYAKIQLDRKKN